MSKEFGHWMQLNRERLALTQQELAQKLGISQQSVAKWEKGQSYPRPKILRQVSAALGVSYDSAVAAKFEASIGPSSNSAGRGSDQFVLRLPNGMRDELRRLADLDDRSMNAQLIHLIQRGIGIDDGESGQDLASLLRRATILMTQAAEHLDARPRGVNAP